MEMIIESIEERDFFRAYRKKQPKMNLWRILIFVIVKWTHTA